MNLAIPGLDHVISFSLFGRRYIPNLEAKVRTLGYSGKRSLPNLMVKL
jgi:hypothetical protein